MHDNDVIRVFVSKRARRLAAFTCVHKIRIYTSFEWANSEFGDQFSFIRNHQCQQHIHLSDTVYYFTKGIQKIEIEIKMEIVEILFNFM